ncbi:aldehyde dehydrogenase [Amycolatopsis sp. K13G38]|uniref:Aldehyde dehydrogenase n=1 Tax=Amycolatopsis acididurans TaxID=2724524 RepID=A0ABX1JEU8_9PSEU|nr:aldehyde dehydrogenase [Amycolatopsis acididurans]NKQ56767.1 aldehyde dehydrogenase [Amycolatopsis acididurans]
MDTQRVTLFVDGRWTESSSGETIEVIEAATEQALGAASAGNAQDIDRAVSAARRALDGPWGKAAAEERAAVVARFAEALKARGKDTAALVSRENGMPISLSRAVNGFAPSAIIGYYAGLAAKTAREEIRPGMGGETLVRREPIGVVGAIVPWNYPQALAAMKIGPALAAGCTVVLKSSPEAALDAAVFADAATAADLPPGVLNIVPGGRETGQALVDHPGVDKIAFTGSTAAGRAIAARCGELLRPVTLELGGKSAAIVLPDADLGAFARGLPEVSFVNNGQTCHACTRVLAPASRYGEVVEAVTEVARALTIGDPLDKQTAIGPLVSRAQRDRVLGYIEAGKSGGARLTTGGGVPVGRDRGWFVEPAVFADVDNSSVIAREEIFGPVLSVIPHEGIDDAIRIANDSDYGLGGTVWTTDEEQGREIARQVHSGTVGVNTYGIEVNAPFGGVKASGLGREMGPEGLAPYFSLKSIYTTAK